MADDLNREKSTAATEAPLDDRTLTSPDTPAGPTGDRTLTHLGHPAAAQAPGEESTGFSPGQIIDDRYRVEACLGRGGMGEVWRAYDLKLQVRVALKTLLSAPSLNARARELPRAEVRAARQVISPNVCRVFDLVVVDGSELVSMEYIDGTTLLGLLKERGPLEIQEASGIAAQFLAGMEAIHQAGLVHRDIKPENIMITRSGRVVIMDFGLTSPSGSGSYSGTPAYMAPEQRRGEGSDARADVFSAGMVLAEMLSAQRGPYPSSRRTFWEGVRRDPPELPDTPWSHILTKALAADREERYASAQELARVLEEVAFLVEGAEHKTPYPGLVSFTEREAEFFFGREAEVEGLWTKLQHAYLLGLIGASGAGKSSFLQAGVLAVKPDGWAHLQIKPGPRPFAALGRALGVEVEDSAAALAALRHWRSQSDEALLIVDQFEELFTQSPRDVQERFAALLHRAALDADVHVLLSMRDDFLIQCQGFSALAPVFSELTPLGPPVGAALRRALVQPALKCGYRFEDETVVEEMLAEVTRERAALPLIAFTAAKLWEERDQESGYLTREAYDRLGGVGGALAQHAESTLEEVRADGSLIVRELFRNLVTAQGTRAIMEVDELLSVFDEADGSRARAAGVLQSLIDARLLTSYEVREGEDETPQRRVEVVHESLLSVWPRLVRWRTQDADLVQRRDELRQAARLWDSRERSEDLLWSGAAFREFQVWRERYSGGLTALEEAFAVAMVKTAGRVRRRRRRLLAAAIVFLLAVIAGITTLWQRGEAALLRSEAQKLNVLGQGELDSRSTATLAWATKSIELADSLEARELALRALWRGPPTWRVHADIGLGAMFSADDERLLQTRFSSSEEHVRLIRADGSAEMVVPRLHDGSSIYGRWLDPDNDLIYLLYPVSVSVYHHFVWSLRENRALLERETPIVLQSSWDSEADRLITLTLSSEPQESLSKEGTQPLCELLSQTPGAAIEDRILGRVEIAPTVVNQPLAGRLLDQAGRRVADVRNDEVVVFELGASGLSAPIVLGEHKGVTGLAIDDAGRRVASRDDSGEIRVWNLAEPHGPQRLFGTSGPSSYWGAVRFSPDGSLLRVALAAPSEPGHAFSVWSLAQASERQLGNFDLSDDPVFDAQGRQMAFQVQPGLVKWMRLLSPDGAQAMTLPGDQQREVHQISFTSDGRWLAAHVGDLKMWYLPGPYPRVVRLRDGQPSRRRSRTSAERNRKVAFDRQGRWFAFGDLDAIYKWPLEGPREGDIPAEKELLFKFPGGPSSTSMSPDGSHFVIGNRDPKGGSGPLLVSMEDGVETRLPNGFADRVDSTAFSEDGRLVAAVGGQFVDEENVIKVWDVESRRLIATLDPQERISYQAVGFTAENDVLWAAHSGLWQADLGSGESKQLLDGDVISFSASADGQRVLTRCNDRGTSVRRAVFVDSASERVVSLRSHGTDLEAVAIDLTGTVIATIDSEGTIRVGRIPSPEEVESKREPKPHLLFAHPGAGLALDPLGRWVATSVWGEELRLWPMPDLKQPPLYTLPKEELLVKLRSLTNLRIVADDDSATGWALEYEPFPGWRHDPVW